tara:strand:- start:673 stop:1155 length:483 start_codon:yes stop_codon:yes gene_type:complete
MIRNMKNILFVIIVLSTYKLYSQESVISSGGEAKGTTGSLSYSAGQVATNSYLSDEGSMSEGVQHTYQIITLGGIKNNFNISLRAYPNPTKDLLNIQIDDFREQYFVYQLLDIEGRIIQSKRINDHQTEIDVRDLSSGIFLVQILGEKSILDSFRVIKLE